MSTSKNSKMVSFINHRMRVTLQEGRTFVGQLLAFDKHMNLVLADTEEFRRVKAKGKVKAGQPEQEEKRTLGLIILRGETVVSLSVEAGPPPNTDPRDRVPAAQKLGGPGLGVSAGRGLPIAPVGQGTVGLQGPVRGIGGPAPGLMQPGSAGRGAPISAPPVAYGRPPMPGPGGAPAGARPPAGMPPPGMSMPPGFRPPPGMPMPPPGSMPPPGFRPPFPGGPGMPPPGFRPPPGAPGAPMGMPPNFRPPPGGFPGGPQQGPPGFFPPGPGQPPYPRPPQ